MARHKTNNSQARELTDAELDRVSGGDTKTTTTTTAQKIQNQYLLSMQDTLIANY